MKYRLLLSLSILLLTLSNRVSGQLYVDSILDSGVETSLIEISRLNLINDNDSLLLFLNKADSLYPNSAEIKYELSNYYFNRADKNRALVYALQADSLLKDNYVIKEHLAMIYNHLAKYQKSADIYEELIKTYPYNEEFYLRAIEFYCAINFSKALDLMKLYESKFGYNHDWISIKLDLISRISKDDSVKGANYAIDLAKDFYKNDLSNVAGAINLAITYKDFKLNKEAEKVLKDFEKRNGKNGVISLYKASEYLVGGDYNKFYKYSMAGIDEKSSDLYLKSSYLSDFYDGYAKMANDSIREIYGDKLDLILKHARDVYSSDFNICLLYSEWLRGYKSDSTKYIDELKHILTFNNENDYVFENIVFYYLDKNNVDSALYYSDIALNYFPDKAIFYYTKIYNSYLNDDYKTAIELSEKAIEYVNKFSNLHLTFLEILGESYYKVERRDEAYEVFDYLLKLDPNNLMILNNYAYYLSLEKSKLEEARRMSYKTIFAEPLNPVYLDTYAWILYLLEDYENAEKYMKKSIDNMDDDSDRVTYYEHYSEILKANNKVDLAEQYMKMADELKNR